MKMKTIYIYSVFLAWCFLGFSSYAQETPIEIKIDFAKVQDVSGDQPNKTAACIIAWVAGDAEEKIFCRYELNKNREFWIDNTEVNNILYTKTGKLFTATSKKVLEQKINEWLANIEKGLSRKKLPPIHSKISQLFDEFIKQGVKDYSTYEAGLFKNTKPYDLVLLKKLNDSKIITYETFAFLAHYEIHRVVSAEPNILQNMVDKYGKGFLEVLKRQDINQLLSNKAIVELLSKPEIVTFLKELDQKYPSASAVLANENSRALLEEYAEVLKIAGIDKLLVSDSETKSIIEMLRANPSVVKNLGDKNFIVTDESFIVAGESRVLERVVMLVVCGILLLVVILWHARNSQKRMDDIRELKKQVDESYYVINETYKKVAQVKTAIVAQKAKVWLERETQQPLTETKGELSQTQQIDAIAIQVATKLSEIIIHLNKNSKVDLLQKIQNALSNEKMYLKEDEIKRIAKAVSQEVTPQLSKQKGTWWWLQNVLVALHGNYKNAVLAVQNLHDSECDKIIKLLNLESILTHWRDFITDNPHFESDQKLLRLLEARDASMWLSNILRADELLKTYFSDKAQLKSLATPLTIAAIMLQAALQELGVEVTKPVLLESPPASLPQSARKKAENPLLMELVHRKVMPKLQSEKTGKLVVDIERYGFVTQGTQQTAMKVLVAELGGWEFYQK
jgi:hypothetical protein